MGFLKDKHDLRLINNIPATPGMCMTCGTEHEPELPHNRQSLFYQYKFYDKYGRWPTWNDAMEHCSDEIKALWKEVLELVMKEQLEKGAKDD